MASIRHRFLGPASPSPSPTREGKKAEEVRLAPVSKILTGTDSKIEKKDHKKRKNGLIFFLGGFVGIVVAGFFAGRSDLVNFPEFGDLSMDNLLDVLPAGFMKEARDLAVCFYLLFGRRVELMRSRKVKEKL